MKPGKGGGLALAVGGTLEAPFSSPRSTPVYGNPPKGSDRHNAFESKEAPPLVVEDASEASTKGSDWRNGDDSVDVVTISADSMPPFDPEILRAPRRARETDGSIPVAEED